MLLLSALLSVSWSPFTPQFLIRSGAPLHINNAHNERPIDLLPAVLSQDDFSLILLEAYGSLMPIGLEFLLSCKDPQTTSRLHNELKDSVHRVFVRSRRHCDYRLNCKEGVPGTPLGDSSDEEEEDRLDGNFAASQGGPTSKVRRRPPRRICDNAKRRKDLRYITGQVNVRSI